MQKQHPTAKWLRDQYGDQASAVAGCYHRSLGFDSKDGGHVLEDLRRFAFVYNTTATVDRNGAVDPMQMAINEGRRQLYQHLVNVLQMTDSDLKKPEVLDDERDQRRASDGPEPRPRFRSGPDPFLDGPEPQPKPAGTEPEPGAGE